MLLEYDQDLYELSVQDTLISILNPAYKDENTVIKIIKSYLKQMPEYKKSAVLIKDKQVYIKQYVSSHERKRREFSYETYFAEDLEIKSLDEILGNIINESVLELIRAELRFADPIIFSKYFMTYIDKHIAKTIIKTYEEDDENAAFRVAQIIKKENVNKVILAVFELLFKEIGRKYEDDEEREAENFLKWFDSSEAFDPSADVGDQKFSKPKLILGKSIVSGVYVIQVVKNIQLQKNKLTDLEREINRSRKLIFGAEKDLERLHRKLVSKNNDILKKENYCKHYRPILSNAKSARSKKDDLKFHDMDKQPHAKTHQQLKKFIPELEQDINKHEALIVELKNKKGSLIRERNTLETRKTNSEAKIKSYRDHVAIIKADMIAPLEEYNLCVKAVGKAIVFKRNKKKAKLLIAENVKGV